MKLIGVLLSGLLLLNITVFAQDLQKVRWTPKDQNVGEISVVLAKLSQQLQIPLSLENFLLVEKRELQGISFSYYQQIIDQVPVRHAGVRIWQNAQTQALIQMRAAIKNPTTAQMKQSRLENNLFEFGVDDLNFVQVQKIVGSDLKTIRNFKFNRQWAGHQVVLMLQVFGKDRSIEYQLNPRNLSVQAKKVRLFPRADAGHSRQNAADEYSVQGHVLKVNEDYEMPWGRRASGAVPELVELKYLKRQIKATKQDWTSALPQKEFSSVMMDEAKAATPEGREQGYWSTKTVQEMIDAATAVVPVYANEMVNGAYLAGRYVDVLIHQEALQQFAIQNFTPFYSTSVNRAWSGTPEGWVFKLNASSYGRPFFTPADLISRQAPYESQRNTAGLINEGFDEMQVYWAVTNWFESMQQAGFTDVELSTRPVQAFLFDPDIEMQNNAYYTDDTINFTTYTSDSVNEVRNLITIWHELGHGLMDRLQGSSGFDNGGLSEGIADFAAEMALRGYYKNQIPEAIKQRRIVNGIGFQLTSEAHDDGEAYGGSLNDLMERKIAQDGFIGYAKVSDMVLDAMRLTRHSSDLSLLEWYEALVLADELGKSNLRAPQEFSTMLPEIFAHRNYVYQQAPSATMTLTYEGHEVTDSGLASRSEPIATQVAEGQSQKFALQLKVVSAGDIYKYPLKVLVSYKETNGLQGAARFKDEKDQVFQLNSANDTLPLSIELLSGCDAINTSDNSCKDFVNVQVFAKDAGAAFAKKRFYIENSPSAKLGLKASR